MTSELDKNIWELDNLPNRLTIFRMVLVPVVVIPLYFELLGTEKISLSQNFLNYFAGWTFVLASITDFFDGYLARKRKMVTVFGSFLDPIADKFLVVSSLIILLALERLDALLVILLIMREMYITSLRLLALDHHVKLEVGKLGKWKTAFQMIGIPLIMVNDNWAGTLNTLKLGKIFIYIAVTFSILSAIRYTYKLISNLKKYKQN